MKTALTIPDPAMNKTEFDWFLELDALRKAGEVQWYGFEAVTLKLAHATRYTPDFAVLWADGSMSMDEVKGFWRDDARVKIKVAARLFPMFRFRAIQRGKRGEPRWKLEEIKA